METLLITAYSEAFPFLLGGVVRENWAKVLDVARTAAQAMRDPKVELRLMHDAAADNHPFFQQVTHRFYRLAKRPHPKLFMVPAKHYGVALCPVQSQPGWYFNAIEASGRRNVRKALNKGYSCRRVDYNAHLDDVTAIHRSSEVRQGRALPGHLLAAATPIQNPPSQDPRHDYPYFGVFQGDALVAYMSCLIAGELCAIESIYGHAAHQENGVVPLLLTTAVDDICQNHPAVRFIQYDTYYGASASLQRFKRKFLFHPHRVTWRL